MNIVVLIKQVPDMNAVKIDRATGKPIFGGQNVISSFDEYAIEEAIRLKEHHGGEIVVVSAGGPTVKEAISRALAMGADRAIQIQLANADQLDTLALAEVLAGQVEQISHDLVLVGQNSDDVMTGHVGPQLAEVLGIPHVSSVTNVDVDGTDFTIHRDTEDGKQVVEVAAPVLLMAMTGLNEPRYPSIKGVMAAKRKPVEQVTASAAPDSARLAWREPYVPERAVTGTIVQDVAPADAAKQLVGWLRENKLI